MRNLGLRILILLYWITGRGPWIVVGQYHDDAGIMRRFRTWSGWDGKPGSWGDLDQANRYCENRNADAHTDPLGTTYYVWHDLEYKHFGQRSKRA